MRRTQIADTGGRLNNKKQGKENPWNKTKDKYKTEDKPEATNTRLYTQERLTNEPRVYTEKVREQNKDRNWKVKHDEQEYNLQN